MSAWAWVLPHGPGQGNQTPVLPVLLPRRVGGPENAWGRTQHFLPYISPRTPGRIHFLVQQNAAIGTEGATAAQEAGSLSGAGTQQVPRPTASLGEKSLPRPVDTSKCQDLKILHLITQGTLIFAQRSNDRIFNPMVSYAARRNINLVKKINLLNVRVARHIGCF